MTEIYRIQSPVGMSWEDVEYVTSEILVGTYEDAANAASDIDVIEFYDPLLCTWNPA